MKRREFITFLGGAAATWPLTVRAQERRQLIGVLSGFSTSNLLFALPALFKELKNAGFVEGKNVSIETRWAEQICEGLAVCGAEDPQSPVMPARDPPSEQSPQRPLHADITRNENGIA
jgi:putative ABC transport system substrate-binding protein